MARPKSSTLTPSELEFMELLWKHGKMDTEKFQNELARMGRDLSDGSIRKNLSILIKKGKVERYKEGRKFYYSALVVKERTHQNLVQDLMQRAFQGSESKLVAALLDNKNIKQSELDKIQELIRNYESGEK